MTIDCSPPLNLDWDEIAFRLAAAANTSKKQLMLGHLLSGLRKQMPFLPPEETVMELLTIAILMGDKHYSPSGGDMSAIGADLCSSPSPLPP